MCEIAHVFIRFIKFKFLPSSYDRSAEVNVRTLPTLMVEVYFDIFSCSPISTYN